MSKVTQNSKPVRVQSTVRQPVDRKSELSDEQLKAASGGAGNCTSGQHIIAI